MATTTKLPPLPLNYEERKRAIEDQAAADGHVLGDWESVGDVARAECGTCSLSVATWTCNCCGYAEGIYGQPCSGEKGAGAKAGPAEITSERKRELIQKLLARMEKYGHSPNPFSFSFDDENEWGRMRCSACGRVGEISVVQDTTFFGAASETCPELEKMKAKKGPEPETTTAAVPSGDAAAKAFLADLKPTAAERIHEKREAPPLVFNSAFEWTDELRALGTRLYEAMLDGFHTPYPLTVDEDGCPASMCQACGDEFYIGLGQIGDEYGDIVDCYCSVLGPADKPLAEALLAAMEEMGHTATMDEVEAHEDTLSADCPSCGRGAQIERSGEGEPWGDAIDESCRRRYCVELRRTIKVEEVATYYCEASSEEEAEELAIDAAYDGDVEWEEHDSDVIDGPGVRLVYEE